MRIRFLRKHSNISSITKYNPETDKDFQKEALTNQLTKIDQTISELSKGLLEASLVSLKTTFTQPKGFFNGLQRQWYGAASQESVKWHTDRLASLYQEKRKLQYKFEKLSNVFWKKRLIRWLQYGAILLLILFILWVVIMGFLTAIYLLPIWGSILIFYFLIQNNRIRRL